MTGSHSEEQAYKLHTGAKSLLKMCTFNLHKFSTNSRSMQTKVDEEECPCCSNTAESSDSTETFTQVTLGRTQGLHDGEHKVLGITWNVLSDQIIFSLTKLAEQAKNLESTKRNVSLIGQSYDLLGFISPIMVKYKIFIQALCEAKISWDETILELLMNQWSKLVAVWRKFSQYRFLNATLTLTGCKVKLWCIDSVGTAIPRYLPMRQLSTCGLKLKTVSTGSLLWPKPGSLL